jgi:hypothetical protein
MGRNSVLKPITIPDALLDWARTPDVAIHMSVDYANQIDDLLSDNDTLTPSETIRLLNLLEGLCFEAIRHDQHDLLLGFDTFTAEWLGLHYTLSDNTIIGRNGDWTFQEVGAVLDCQTPEDAMRAAMAVKDLVSAVFPEARIGAIIDAETAEPACAGCGTSDAGIMLTLETGGEYCRSCWTDLTTRTKLVETPSKRSRRAVKQASGTSLFEESEAR